MPAPSIALPETASVSRLNSSGFASVTVCGRPVGKIRKVSASRWIATDLDGLPIADDPSDPCVTAENIGMRDATRAVLKSTGNWGSK